MVWQIYKNTDRSPQNLNLIRQISSYSWLAVGEMREKLMK